MYHAIVRRMVRDGFRRLSTTRSGTHIVAQFVDTGVFAFAGDGVLGGERRGRAEIGAWFARLFELFPDFAITPLAIVVAGPPWATIAASRFHVTATLPDGTPYTNEGMQFIRLRFGKILEDRIYEDTAKLERALGRIAVIAGTA